MIPRNNGLVIEYLVDSLFGEGVRGHIARLLCKGPQPVTPQRIEEIATSVQRLFPQKFEASRRSSIVPLVSEIQRDIDEFLDDPRKTKRMLSEIGLNA